MPKKESTQIVFVVDRSGSMSNIAEDMNGGFAALIKEQASKPGECLVSLHMFDNEHDVIFKRRDVRQVPPLGLKPRGGTALLDAMGRAIVSTGEDLAKLPEEERPEAVLFVVITDGHENASVEFRGETGKRRIAEMIKHQSEVYKWDFIFLGANQNAFKVAEDYGIMGNQAATFDPNKGGAQAVMRSVSNKIGSYRSASVGGKSEVLKDMQLEYNAELKSPKAKDTL